MCKNWFVSYNTEVIQLQSDGMCIKHFKKCVNIEVRRDETKGIKLFPGIMCIIQWKLYIRLETCENATGILLTACCHQTVFKKKKIKN